MKVKVKQTGEVIDVEFVYCVNRLGFRENVYADSFNGTEYYASELEKIDNNENVDKICNILKEMLFTSYDDNGYPFICSQYDSVEKLLIDFRKKIS